MPIINAQILAGRTPEQKRAFIRELSRATVETLAVPAEAVRIVLTEVPADHWGVGSRTMTELRAEGVLPSARAPEI